MKLNTLSKIIFLAVLLLSFVLAPFSNADAKGKKNSRNITSAKSDQARKKSSLVKKKKTKIAKQKKHSRKKTYAVAAKSKKRLVKKGAGYVASKVIVPELEIVMPEGEFHYDYDTGTETTEMTSRQAADEFQAIEAQN